MPKTEKISVVTQFPKQPVNPKLRGKDEMNLAEFPIAKIGRNDKRLTIEYEGQIVDKTGTVVSQKWVVSGSPKFGLPTEFAERVLVGLMTLTARERFESRKVPFTIYKVLKLLGLTHNKRNYQAVIKALRQLVGVTISSEGAFYDKNQKKRVTTIKDFHLLEEFWLKSFESDQEVIASEESNGYIIWSDRLFKSFEAGYIKNLDVDFYYSLENTIARRLFRFLDKRMHYQDEYQIDIYDLVGRLGMKKAPYPSRLKSKMQPAFEELVQRGFLEKYEYLKVSKYHRVKFYKAGDFRTLQAPLFDLPDTHPDDIESELLQELPVSLDSAMQSGWDAIFEAYSTTQEIKRLWVQTLGVLKSQMPSGHYRQVSTTKLLSISGGVATIGMMDSDIAKRSQPGIEKQVRTALGMFADKGIKEVQFITVSN